jgi:hypothetical protein
MKLFLLTYQLLENAAKCSYFCLPIDYYLLEEVSTRLQLDKRISGM